MSVLNTTTRKVIKTINSLATFIFQSSIVFQKHTSKKRQMSSEEIDKRETLALESKDGKIAIVVLSNKLSDQGKSALIEKLMCITATRAIDVLKCDGDTSRFVEIIALPTNDFCGVAASTLGLCLATARMSDGSNMLLSNARKGPFNSQQENEVKKQNKRAQKLENRNRHK